MICSCSDRSSSEDVGGYKSERVRNLYGLTEIKSSLLSTFSASINLSMNRILSRV